MKTPLVIHLFTTHGATFSFGQCEVLVNNETTLVFRYRAANDGLEKEMYVVKANLLGYSTGEGELQRLVEQPQRNIIDPRRPGRN